MRSALSSFRSGWRTKKPIGRQPDIKLQMGYDGSHPTLAGQYLAGAVVYGSLYGKSAVGNPYDYFGALDKDTKTFVQRVADETVRKFYGR